MTHDTLTDADQLDNPAVVYFDGACRGNPGPSARAAVLKMNGEEIASVSQQLRGKLTNNQAEYRALEAALYVGRRYNFDELVVRGDSELIVKQVNGEYAVNDEALQTFHDRVTDLLDKFSAVAIEHVPREENERADALASEAVATA
jgi:ribonuclease HI